MHWMEEDRHCFVGGKDCFEGSCRVEGSRECEKNKGEGKHLIGYHTLPTLFLPAVRYVHSLFGVEGRTLLSVEVLGWSLVGSWSCMVAVEGNHQTEEDNHQMGEGNHQTEGDNHQMREENHQIGEDNLQMEGGSLLIGYIP